MIGSESEFKRVLLDQCQEGNRADGSWIELNHRIRPSESARSALQAPGFVSEGSVQSVLTGTKHAVFFSEPGGSYLRAPENAVLEGYFPGV